MRIQADYFKVSSTLPTEIARRKAWIPRMKGDLQDTKRQVRHFNGTTDVAKWVDFETGSE